MFGLGVPELVVILVILLVIFGPGKLPQLGASLGETIKSFRKGAQDEPRVINPKDEEKPQQ
ncbi:MAG: TatA/E family twin-arginine translocation protein [Geobacteraceae bacterium GWC2_58_44]|nr:MAG: TatA/E family twin-arginine translocation protein [Geobacteraceae bacterium GWC2_58_44]HBG05091.1 twin-arginine translocase TatA/TatE family subunit [Geobacter sp.]